MKKFIAVALTLALTLLTFASCSGTKQNETTTAETTTAETTAPSGTDETNSEAEETSAEAELTGLSKTVADIYAKSGVDLHLMTRDIDLTDADALRYNTGLESADMLTSAVVSEPMIGSQAYSLVLVKLNDAAKAEETANTMKTKINMNKWICVSADTIRVVASGDTIMLFMIDSMLAQDLDLSVDSIVDAFKTVVGELSVEL